MSPMVLSVIYVRVLTQVLHTYIHEPTSAHHTDTYPDSVVGPQRFFARFSSVLIRSK